MKKRIFILDDDKAVLEMIEEALIYENFEVMTWNCSREALSQIEQFKPDVILLDFLVGDINGGEICHQIKTNPATMHIPVIIISGFQRVFDSLGTYGSDFFMPKPFDLTTLVDTINSCLVKA